MLLHKIYYSITVLFVQNSFLHVFSYSLSVPSLLSVMHFRKSRVQNGLKIKVDAYQGLIEKWKSVFSGILWAT